MLVIKLIYLRSGKMKTKQQRKIKVKLTNEYYKELKKDFLIAVIFTIPIFLISMGMMWENFHTVFARIK